jgi:hypothetical protein
VSKRDFNNVRRGELKRLLRHRGVSEFEVRNAVEDILAERVRWTAAALGQRMNLAFLDKIRFGIKTIACVDRTKKMVRLYFRERKRERDRMRQAKMRARILKMKEIHPISSRAKQLAAEMGDNWMASGALAVLMMPRWHLKREAVLSAVLRTARELCKADIAEQRIAAGTGGGRVLLLRLKRPGNTNVLRYPHAGNADEIRVP